jgi:hypothetical protein
LAQPVVGQERFVHHAFTRFEHLAAIKSKTR